MLNARTKNRYRLVGALAVTGLLLAASAGHATASVVYNAAADFNNSNPNGVWSYYGSNTNSPNTDVALSVNTNAPSGFEGLSNQGTDPDWIGVTKNTGSSPANINGFSLDPSQLLLDPEYLAVIVRFTAPTAATYDVNATFYGLDWQNRLVQIVRDNGLAGSTTLLTDAGFAGGSQDSYTEPLVLSAGETLDFVVAENTDYTYEGTGLAATITQVPEPASAALLLLGLGGVTLRRRRGLV